MEFILNTKQNKIEIWYENQKELESLLMLLSDNASYKEQKFDSTISTTPFIGHVEAIPCSNTHSINQSHLPTCPSIGSEDVPTVTFDGSDEGGYSCLVASVPRKTK